MIIYDFTSHSRIFHLYEDVIITGEWLQNFGLSVLRTFEQEGIDLYRATPAVTRGLSFSCIIQRAAPFSRLLRHTRGCGELILTRIPIHSPLTCCDTGLSFSCIIQRATPFSRLLRHTWGCGEPILTRILTGL
jgi:hypothetical protein